MYFSFMVCLLNHALFLIHFTVLGNHLLYESSWSMERKHKSKIYIYVKSYLVVCVFKMRARNSLFSSILIKILGQQPKKGYQF